MNIVADNSSIMKRIFGHEDHIFLKTPTFDTFFYYLPSYIQSSFASFKFGALIFAASNIISPFSIYLIWKYRFFYKGNNSNQLFLNGLSLVLSYTLFALIFLLQLVIDLIMINFSIWPSINAYSIIQ